MPSLNINRHVNKHMSQIEPKSKDLATKVFEKTSFQLGWILVLASFFYFCRFADTEIFSCFVGARQ